MNSDRIPELHRSMGYLFAIGLMSMMALGLTGFMWRRGRLGR